MSLHSHAQVEPSPATAPAGEVRVRGAVTRIIFHDPASDFCIFSLRPHGGVAMAKAKGYWRTPAVGREVDCTGSFAASKNPKYPEPELVSTSIIDVLPVTFDGVGRLLRSGFIAGLSDTSIDALLRHFGAALLQIAETAPQQIYQARLVPPAQVAALVSGLDERKATPRIMTHLASIGLPPTLARAVFKLLGADAVEQVRANPLLLAAVPEIGFARADLVARAGGMVPQSPLRIAAGLRAALATEMARGSTAMPLARLRPAMMRLLAADGPEIDPSALDAVIEHELGEGGAIVLRQLACGPCVSTAELVRQEMSIAYHLARLCTHYRAGAGQMLSSRRFAHLDTDQLAAARMALAAPVSVLTGRPGCGKTTTTRSIVEVMVESGLTVRLSAPTGCAAKRLAKTTGHPAATNHRLLEAHGDGGFRRHSSRPLELDRLLMDETGMLDTAMMERTLSAIPDGAGLLLVGDFNQLKSVGEGSVLADVIGSGCLPVAVLSSNIYRHGADSSIHHNAHRILDGLVPEQRIVHGRPVDFEMVDCTDEKAQVQAVIDQLQAFMDDGYASEDIQILTPARHKTELGVTSLNVAIKQFLNPAEGKPSVTVRKFERDVVFSVGDRVMQTTNNDDLGIYNGDVGYLRELDPASGSAVIDFDGESVALDRAQLCDLDHAFVTTIHKALGGEYPAVIIVVSRQHMQMWDRSLLYTGITRARRRVATVGDNYLMKRIVERESATRRLTGLKEEIVAMFDALAANQAPRAAPGRDCLLVP